MPGDGPHWTSGHFASFATIRQTTCGESFFVSGRLKSVTSWSKRGVYGRRSR
jgi:hypothetical protein